MDLQSHWLQLMAGFGAETEEAMGVFHDLARHYQSPGRDYHNLDHIGHMLAVVTEVQPAAAQNWTAVQLAIWFHDVIYIPGAPDNEEQSARFARERLPALGVDEETLQVVTALILATKMGGPAVTHPDAPLIQDADLATLGWAPAAYDDYAQAIRHEFTPIPDEAYRHGRAQVLTIFLQRPRIYQTVYFYTRWEDQARQNMQRELDSLQS